jgi:hypothetical protein
MGDRILRDVRRELAKLAVTRIVAGDLTAAEAERFKRLCAFERDLVASRPR